MFLAVLLLPGPTTKSRERLIPFLIPPKMFPLEASATPAEYELLNPAIKANWGREEGHEEKEVGIEPRPDFDKIRAVHIPLGALGDGLVVYFDNFPECGATGNCPIAVYVWEAKGYRRAIDAGGWGFAPLPSKGAVPDLAFYWQMSATETDAVVFHYAKGQFREQGRRPCTDQSESDPVCAAPAKTAFSSASPAEYKELRPAVEANLKKHSLTRSVQVLFDQAHAVNVFDQHQMVVTAIELEPCDSKHNCSISVYAHGDGNSYSPLLVGASGWSVSNVQDIETVIARHLSANRAELTKYRLNSIEGLGGRGQLLPRDCEDITPKGNVWPTNWDPTAFSVQPVPCSKTP